ncbi:hypothetical protein PVAND_005999 [Polypedilum vanderplanki]|uniref:Odorant receptor n=1 Tax=Polypedilum vanderplanki TaxID=319348 RepID=A0A9J6C2P2_POLVA|nr:hypothetical protein PVAND_005999 [Polypedilum vanderplanki]
MRAIFQKNLLKIKQIFNSTDLFVIEKWYLTKFSFWPEHEISRWRILLLLTLDTAVGFIPTLLTVKTSLENKDYSTSVKGMTYFFLCILVGFLPMTLFHHNKNFKILIGELNKIWFKNSNDEFPICFGSNWTLKLLFYIYKIFYMPFVFSSVILYYVTNSLFLKLINYTASCYYLLYEKIDNVDKMLATQCENEIIHEEIKKLIKDHVTILEMSKLVQKSISDYMLLCYMVISALICFLSFTFSHSNNIFDDCILLIIQTRLIFSLLIILFLFSYFGSKLMNNSLDVSTRIGNISWYNVKSRNVQKYFILMMLRAQRKEGIKAGKFYFITFSSFLEAMNAIISYFSVLKALVLGKK